MAGAGNVHATVNLSYLTGSEEHTDEVYDPAQSVAVSTQKTEGSALTTSKRFRHRRHGKQHAGGRCP